MNVRYTVKALKQLDEIFSYIAESDPGAAQSVKARIQRAINRLGRHPYSARPTERAGIRVLAVVRYPYLVFYTVDEAAREVHILRIRHSSQDPARHLD
ncbi:MAG: type II toxin-antitoxin system RelE/ParE family toxin [Hyphomicrobiaceae bacterium]